jgi:hypothetical protein
METYIEEQRYSCLTARQTKASAPGDRSSTYFLKQLE